MSASFMLETSDIGLDEQPTLGVYHDIGALVVLLRVCITSEKVQELAMPQPPLGSSTFSASLGKAGVEVLARWRKPEQLEVRLMR